MSELIRSAGSQGGAKAQQRESPREGALLTLGVTLGLRVVPSLGTWLRSGCELARDSPGLGAARVDGVGAGPGYTETEWARRQLCRILGWLSQHLKVRMEQRTRKQTGSR